jgi:DNA end-binding protein Ku
LLYDEITEEISGGLPMAKAFWKGVISFGMVVIPVKMYVATETKSISFHVLHKKCLTRPKQVWHCEKDDEYFPTRETVRGYEYGKEQYIVLDEADFQKIPVKTAHSIGILGFVAAQEIDPLYYQNSHYIEPESLGVKPFSLLNSALTRTKKVGLAKEVFQRKEHLCVLRPLGSIMALHSLYYPDEILSYSDLVQPDQKNTPAEMEMASSLVNAMAMPFKPEEYKDEYVKGLKKMVEAKLKGVELKAPPEPKVEIPDLMAALKASLAEAKKKRKPVAA